MNTIPKRGWAASEWEDSIGVVLCGHRNGLSFLFFIGVTGR